VKSGKWKVERGKRKEESGIGLWFGVRKVSGLI